jgi:cysteine desulfurase family protein (TIGR01976 family)
MTRFDPLVLRPEFPALAGAGGGRAPAFFDGPGGTQVPQRVIDAVGDYYRRSNANQGGAFATSERSDAIVEEARAAVADLYGAASADEIHFGPNMTTLTFHLSRAIGAALAPGDEIVVTTLDHEANVGPWESIARDRGLVIRKVDIRVDDITLDLDDLDAKLGPRTRLVAVGYASNAVGTINPVREIVERAHAVGAWSYVDAVAYAPHGPIDLETLDTDFLVSSPYKWYGPHAGALYARAEVLAALPRYKLRPAHDAVETGTQSFEAIAGVGAAVEYLASVGDRFGGPYVQRYPAATGRRLRLLSAMAAIREYEAGLHDRLMAGLREIRGVRIRGITDTARFPDEKAPTVSVTLDRVAPREAARLLGEVGIYAWDGDFYAQGLVERLGLAEQGGLLRLGIAHYTTFEEIDRLLERLEAIAVQPAGVRTG